MSMYPDESIKDSPSEKRRKIFARLFWVFLATTLLLAASAIYLNISSSASLVSAEGSAEPSVSVSPRPSSSPSSNVITSAAVEKCNSLVETKPGDVEYVMSLGWEFKCIDKGADPDLGDNGNLDDLYTYGYADPQTKTIAIDAPEVTPETIVHEAAHVIDFEQLVQSDRDSISAKYGASDWNNVSDYFNRPSEMFAEARMRCLGYEHDPDFGVMSCEDVELLISGTAQSDEINSLANSKS